MKKYFWLFGLTFVPYLALLAFVHPAADDFTFSDTVIDNGYWHTQYKIYTEWFGRYFSTLLVTFNPVAIRRFDLYKIYPLLVFLLMGLGLFYFISSLLRSFSWKEKAFVTLGIFSLFVSRMPSVVEGFYWMPGSTNYTLGLPIFLVALGFVLKKLSFHMDANRYLPERFSFADHIFLFVSSFIICGFNETIMFLWVLSLSVLILYFWIGDRKVKKDLIYILIGALIWSAVVALAPGNKVRAAQFSGNFAPFSAVGKSVVFGIWHFFRFFGPAFIAALLLFGFWVSHHRERFNPALLQRASRKYLWSILALLLIGSLFPAFISMDGLPPRRVLNMVCLFHNLIVLVLVVSWALKSDFFLLFFQRRFVSERILFVMMAVFLVLVGNHRKAIVDLFTKAPEYNRSLNERYQKMKDNPGGDIVVPALVDPPRSICFDDITEDPSDWRNSSYALYFGVKSIKKVEAQP